VAQDPIEHGHEGGQLGGGQVPRSWFVTLTTIGLIGSFVLPVISDAGTATKVVLSISHLVVALIIVPPLALALHPQHRASNTLSGSGRAPEG
jgi:hypothetical protein